MRIRACYQEHLGQWGPSVLAAWAKREGLGSPCPQTIANAISDLRPSAPPKKKACRYSMTSPGVMWAEDGAAFRDLGKKRELLVVQDECSRFKLAHRLAPGPASGKDVLALLAQVASRHELPLVLKRDGGSIFDERQVMVWLDAHDVVVLTSPPGYPQYNGKKERSFRDVRGYERALLAADPRSTLSERIDRAIHDLNEDRPRPVLGGRTAREAQSAPRRALPSRAEFRKEVESTEQKLLARAASRHERDAARRQAVLKVLSNYRLMKWRGDLSTEFQPADATE